MSIVIDGWNIKKVRVVLALMLLITGLFQAVSGLILYICSV